MKISILSNRGWTGFGFDCVTVGRADVLITKEPGSVGLTNGVAFGMELYNVGGTTNAK